MEEIHRPYDEIYYIYLKFIGVFHILEKDLGQKKTHGMDISN